MVNSFLIMYGISLAVLLATAYYINNKRKSLDEMHGMMVGMTLGMLSGLVAATFYLIPTGNFLYGVIIGSLAGLLFGIPLGKLGGHLGMMEGVIAGPMGGMMGAMLGQMVRPFSLEIFVPFFTFILLITLAGLSYTIHCRSNCCEPEQTKKPNVSKSFMATWVITSLVVLAISFALPFSLEDSSSNSSSSLKNYATDGSALPPALQELTKEERAEAVLKDGYQDVELRVTSSRYYPNVIVAKKGIPLRINVQMAQNAGCAQEILFPDFDTGKLIPAGGSDVLEFTPNKEGTFKFRCSMDMVRGQLIVTA